MKLRYALCAGLVAAIAPLVGTVGAIAQTTPQFAQANIVTRTGTVTAYSLYVRRAPGTDSAILGALTQGAEVTILSQSGTGRRIWYRVRTTQSPQLEGWVSALYLNVTSTTATSETPMEAAVVEETLEEEAPEAAAVGEEETVAAETVTEAETSEEEIVAEDSSATEVAAEATMEEETVPEVVVSPLVGTVWQLQQIQYSDNTQLIPGLIENYTLEFLADGQLSIRADCNQVRGRYTEELSTIALELGASTRVACPPASLDRQYLQGLSRTAIYVLQEGDLYLDLLADAGTMRFSAAPAPVLQGTAWQLQQIQYSNDTLLVPGSPANYTLEFLEDGQLGLRADCNQVQGTYTEAGNRLTAETGASTLVACPPGSIDTAYIQAINTAALYFLQDGNLYIDLAVDTGTMQFSPLGN